MRVYIAGPMTGIIDFNFPLFFSTADKLFALGHVPINPAANDGPTLELALADACKRADEGWTWLDYMRLDLQHVSIADAVCVLPGWRDSRGASLEVEIATRLGLPVLCLHDGELVPRVRLLGVSGYARAGKDTFADMLAPTWEKRSFATAIKGALCALNPLIDGWTLPHLVNSMGWDTLKSHPQWGEEVRRLLQRMGAEVGRDLFGENHWVDLALSQIPDGSRVVFADCRFPNEAEAIRAAGGKIIRIKRPGVTAVNDHPSETALDDFGFDILVHNYGSLEDLQVTADVVLSEGL